MALTTKTELIHHVGVALDVSPDWHSIQYDVGAEKANVWAWAHSAFLGWVRGPICQAPAIRLSVIKLFF